MAYYSLDPWNAERKHDLPAALVCSTVANANRSSKTKAFSPADFLPRYGETESEVKSAADAELLANFKSFSRRQEIREKES